MGRKDARRGYLGGRGAVLERCQSSAFMLCRHLNDHIDVSDVSATSKQMPSSKDWIDDLPSGIRTGQEGREWQEKLSSAETPCRLEPADVRRMQLCLFLETSRGPEGSLAIRKKMRIARGHQDG